MALPIVCQAKRSRSLTIGAGLLLLLAACARTGLHPGDLGESDDETNGSGGSSATPSAGGANLSSTGGMPAPVAGMAGAPLTAGAPTQAGGSAQSVDDPQTCQPRSESCNGRDDDCNGAVDDVAAEPCDGGGFRFCVAGRMSECPRRCETCVPGSIRVCQNPYCTFWGEQECAADGQGFGNCREADPPPECAGIARTHQQSPELEQCCLDNGYCCEDEFDLDGDGDRREMLGACQDIACQ